MAELIDVFNQNDITPENFMKQLNGKDLVIYEDVQGSKLYVTYTGDRFIIKPKSLRNDEINLVDLAYQKFYGKAYLFFHTLPSYVTDMLNKKWTFVFEYLPDTCVGSVTYSRIPQNHLILTSIVKAGKHRFNYDELVEYSNLFGCDVTQLIFKGKLNAKQIEIINLYLKTSAEDLKFIFGEESFAKFFYNILNPSNENSFLMDKDEYNDNLEKIIIRINSDDKFSFAILNPLYERTTDDNQTEHAHVFSLIIVSFLEFLQLLDFDKVKITGLTKDEIYVNLISSLFNEYLANMKDDIESWEFFVPEFIKDDKFKINTDLIRNKETQKSIKSSDKIEYIFKVILGSFKKYRKKPIGVMKKTTVDLFNKSVDKISNYIDNSLNINRDYIFQKIDLLNFNDYFNIKFDRDAAGEVYPETAIDFQDGEIGGGKKGGKKGFDIKKKE